MGEEALLVLANEDVDECAAFSVLSNICNSFRASGPSLEGSPEPRNGEYMLAAVADVVLLLEVEGVAPGDNDFD